METIEEMPGQFRAKNLVKSRAQGSATIILFPHPPGVYYQVFCDEDSVTYKRVKV